MTCATRKHSTTSSYSLYPPLERCPILWGHGFRCTSKDVRTEPVSSNPSHLGAQGADTSTVRVFAICCKIALSLIEWAGPAFRLLCGGSGISPSFKANVYGYRGSVRPLTPSSPKTGIMPSHQRFFVDCSSQNR